MANPQKPRFWCDAERLIPSVIAGDPIAEELFWLFFIERFYPRASRFAAKYGDEAKSYLQEACEKCKPLLGLWDPPRGRLSTFLWRPANNAIIDHARKWTGGLHGKDVPKHVPLNDASETGDLDKVGDPEEELLVRENFEVRQRALQRAVDSLEYPIQRHFMKFVKSGMTRKDAVEKVAEVFNISRATAFRRIDIHRTEQAIKEFLVRHYPDFFSRPKGGASQPGQRKGVKR